MSLGSDPVTMVSSRDATRCQQMRCVPAGDSVKALADKSPKRFGPRAIIINCAGIFPIVVRVEWTFCRLAGVQRA